MVTAWYIAQTAAHVHRLMHNQELRVREVYRLLLREAEHHRNGFSWCLLHLHGKSTMVGHRMWNHLQLLLRDHHHIIQTNHQCHELGPIAVLHTDVCGGRPGTTTTLTLMGTTLHVVRLAPNQMPAPQQVGTNHVPFLQLSYLPNKVGWDSCLISCRTMWPAT